MDNKRNILLKYRNILLAVILFMVADALVIGINFYNTYKADESAVSINLAGRQRMLSQRMTKALLILSRALETRNDELAKKNLDELTLAVRLFNTTLKGFRDGANVTGGDFKQTFLTQVETDESREFVQKAYERWDKPDADKPTYLQLLRPLLSSGRENDLGPLVKDAGKDDPKEFTQEQLNEKLKYVKSNRDKLEQAVAYAQANNLEILSLMNSLTFDLEVVANKRAATLRVILVVGILFAFFNFGYTVIVSIRNLMKGDAELAKAREETVEILSTVREGLFLLDREKNIGTQYSKSLPSILKRDIEPGSGFLPHLKVIASKDIYEATVDYIELLLGDRVKEALVTSLNPLTNVPITVADALGNKQTRYLSFFFNRVLQEGHISYLLVTVQDVTDKVVLTEQVEQAKNLAKIEVETLLRLAGSDFEALQQFTERVGQSLSQINEKLSVPHDDERNRRHTLNYIMRVVHGIKGEAATLGIDVLEGYAHECEKEIVSMREGKEPLNSDQLLRIAVLLEGFYQRHSSLAQIVSRLGDVFAKAPPTEEKRPEVAHPITSKITMLAQRIAADHGKQVEVSCQIEKFFSLPEPIVRELQAISIQLVRNALVHGLETPDERSRLNKPPLGALCLWCEYLGNGKYNFTVRDDGRGIVPAHLRERFIQTGLLSAEEAASMSDSEIANHIFQPGVSTIHSADRDAGHGIGLDAVMERVKNMGGRLAVRSRPDRFTEFHIQFSTTD